jgi:small subunit ribosomal protein S17
MSSQYKQIKGIRYSAALLAKAEELTAGQDDGLISQEDAEALLALIGKDGKFSDLEKRSISYVKDNFAFTKQAHAVLDNQISTWAEKKAVGVNSAHVAPVSVSKSSRRRLMTGKVISNKPAGGKTVVVEVERKVVHPKYKKFVKSSSKYYAHDEENVCQINDAVVIQESRPLSKKKRWIVVEHTSAKH